MTYKMKSLNLAIGLAAGSISAYTFAVPVNTLVSAETHIVENGVSSDDSTTPSTSAYLFNYGDNGGFAEAIGETNSGTSNVAANSHANESHIVSQIHQSAVVTNDTGSAQNFTFNFLVNGGSLTSNSYALNTGDYVNATYDLNILVDGISLWNSSAALTLDTNGYSLVKSGVDLNSSSSAGNYSWSSLSGFLSLGVFQNNESFTLDYFLTTSVTNHLTALDNVQCYTNYGYGYGYGYGQGTEYCYHTENGSSYARIGDPNGFGVSSPINSDTITTSNVSVPEPSGLILTGVGLAGLAFRRRTKKSV